jgi:hypothetical protein
MVTVEEPTDAQLPRGSRIHATISGRISPERAAAMAIPLMRLLDAIEAELEQAGREESPALALPATRKIRRSSPKSGRGAVTRTAAHKGASVETAADAPSIP